MDIFYHILSSKSYSRLQSNNIVAIMKEMKEALQRRPKRKLNILDSMFLKSGRILFMVDVSTKMEILSKKFYLVSSHYREYAITSRHLLKHYPQVKLHNVFRHWGLNEICQDLNTNLASNYKNFPFLDIKTQIYSCSRLDNIIKRRIPNTTLGTSVMCNVSCELA